MLKQKNSFALARKLLSPTMPINIPHIPNIEKNELCYEFSNHFTDKIQRACTSISSILPISSIPCICISKPIPYYFSKFYMPSIFTISNLISKSSSSHSSDPINLTAFKQLNYTLSPYILDIIIIYLHDYICPTSFKHAIITHILKKPLLDPNIIANYRPISQLPCIRKILERIVVIQLNRFIAENKLYNIFQSAFRRGHSTETVLQQILNNIYSTVSPSISCQFILLDLSCAFDSLSHSVLISRLEMIGIRGTVLKWFSSYILNRPSSVKICNFSTKSRTLHYGVPQGSVLGPLLF